MADLRKLLQGNFDIPLSSPHSRAVARSMDTSGEAQFPARGVANSFQDAPATRFTAEGSAALQRFREAVGEHRTQAVTTGRLSVAGRPLDMGGLVSAKLNRELDTDNEVLIYNKKQPTARLNSFIDDAIANHKAESLLQNTHLPIAEREKAAQPEIDKLRSLHFPTVAKHAAKLGKKLVVSQTDKGIAARASTDVLSPVALRKWSGVDLYSNDLSPASTDPAGRYLDNPDKGFEFFSK